MTSPYELYQFLLNSSDEEVINHILHFTEASLEEVEDFKNEILNNPGKRTPQNYLANYLTTLIHGEEALKTAISASKALFG